MRKNLAIVVCAALVLTAAPRPASAWGTSAHRYIMGRALDALPPELKPFFDHFRAELVLRVIDPDLWRTVGFDENSNHFLDFGVPEYGAYPFDALPRDHDAAVRKFGSAVIRRNGRLPWREAEMFSNLQRAFESMGRREGSAPTNVVLFAAAVSHYIQDAHQPLHATDNYDGQLTKQQGVHARFETELFDRFAQRLKVDPRPPARVQNARDRSFEVLLESNRLVAALLEADRQAIAGKDSYDDDYFNKLLMRVKPMLEQRLAGAITQTASFVIEAWTRAGKPPLMTAVPQATRRVRR